MPNTTLTGKTGNISGITGGKLDTWRLAGTTVALEDSGFGDGGSHSFVAGLVGGTFTAGGALQKGDGGPAFPDNTTSLLPIVATADSGCTYTFSILARTETISVGYRGLGGFICEGPVSGPIVKSWT